MGRVKTFLLFLVTAVPLQALLERVDAPLLVRALVLGAYASGVFWFAGQRGWVRPRERPERLDPPLPPRGD